MYSRYSTCDVYVIQCFHFSLRYVPFLKKISLTPIHLYLVAYHKIIKFLIKKSLKVFRLKAAILGLQFAKSMMFNCSYFDKSILNVYSPMSPKMFLGPAVGPS